MDIDIQKAIDRYRGDPAYAPGQYHDGRLICGAKKRNSDHCNSNPAPGATRCGKHGGNTPKAKAAATERKVESKARTILGRIDPTQPLEHPVETLLRLIQGKSAEISWLREKVQELSEEQLTFGLVEHQEGENGQGPVDVRTYRAEVNVWWRLLREAENQLSSWVTSAIRAGIEERKVRLAESQGSAVADAIRQILDGLNLTPAQTALIPDLVPRVLRELTRD